MDTVAFHWLLIMFMHGRVDAMLLLKALVVLGAIDRVEQCEQWVAVVCLKLCPDSVVI